MALRSIFALVIVVCVSSPAWSEPASLRAGAAERDITPRVAAWDDRDGDGRHDMGAPMAAWDLGEPVTAFAEGPIPVGNGTGEATHLHGPLYVSALVLEDGSTGARVALVSTDLYMILQPDTEDIRRRVSVKSGIDFVMLASTHNHMGPDTIGLMGLSGETPERFLEMLWGRAEAKSGVNSAWFDRMADLTADAIDEAAAGLRPAVLRPGRTKFRFGMTDEREPHIIDDDLMTLAVDGLDGAPIATVVQGTCHPESVLMYGVEKYSVVPRKDIPAEALEAWGRVITPDFPGWLRKTIRERRGGVPLYFSGALGGMITNITSHIWDPEAHPEYSVNADPATVPDAIKIPTDLRFAQIQGREMAKAALASIDNAAPADRADVSFVREEILIPMENPLFRLVAGLGILGHRRGALYDDDGSPDTRTGHTLNGMWIRGVDVPLGKNAKTEVSVVNVGPAQFINMPSEAVGELTAGLPADFYTNPNRYFPRDAKYHAHGEDFRLKHPPLKKQASRPYPFIVCLAASDFGYIIPEVDFKPPHDIPVPPLSSWWISFDASANPHYEESMTASSKLEDRIMGALTGLLGRMDRGPSVGNH